MPTVKPRIQLTLDQHQHDLLKRLAGLQGVSMASLVMDIIEPACPVLERVCVVLEAAQRAQESSKDGMRLAMAKAEAELLPHLYDAVNQFDLFVDGVAGGLGVSLEGMPESANAIHRAMNGVVAAQPGQDRSGARTGPDGAATSRGPGVALDPPLVTRGSGKKRQVPSSALQAPQKPSRTRGPAK